MLSEEILKKAKLIEVSTRRMVSDVMLGNARSRFKGQGVQFSEHRQYVAGDDVRHIDWKVSARTRVPMIKKFDEERELSVFLIIDLSLSGYFGSQMKLKSEMIAEISALLAQAVTFKGDRVGALIFSGQVEKIIPPKKGKAHILRIVSDVLNHIPAVPSEAPSGTALKESFDMAFQLIKHSGVVFVLSDFLTDGFETSLKRLAKKHEVIAIRIVDTHEWKVPSVGTLLIRNPETGEEGLVDTRSYRFRNWLEGFYKQTNQKLDRLFKSNRVETILLDVRKDSFDPIIRFFQRRRVRAHRV